MAQSIGDLFVKLGFDVDDSKLKSFDESLQGVFDGIKKFAGLAGVGLGVAGFIDLAKGASDTALTIENLTATYGVSAKAIQSWAAQVHENNPLKSFSEGISSFATISSYLNNAAFSPQGVMALNRLGVVWDSSMIGHPEKIIDSLFESVPRLLKENPKNRGLYSQLVSQVTGDTANIGIFERGKAWADTAAARGIVSDDDLAKQAEARRNIAQLSDAWDKFIGHIMGSLAPTVSGVMNAVDKGGAKGFFSWAGEHSWIDKLGAWDPFSLGNIGPATKGIISNENAKGMVRKMGWSDQQASGIIKRLQLESGLNPGAVGDNGEAYGIAQWHPDRQKDFSRWAGHDIHGSSIEEQLQFMNYELTKGNERSAGSKLKATKTAEGAYAAFTNGYERPAITVQVTQNIHSNDPDQAGRSAAQAIQETITPAYLNRLQEPY